ncbi:MAG: hypothetical protein V3U85_01200 [Hyphomicrobium sp.]
MNPTADERVRRERGGILDKNGAPVLGDGRPSDGSCMACGADVKSIKPVLGGNKICMTCGAYQRTEGANGG